MYTHIYIYVLYNYCLNGTDLTILQRLNVGVVYFFTFICAESWVYPPSATHLPLFQHIQHAMLFCPVGPIC